MLDAAYETIRASAGILLIVAVAALFGWILSVEAVPQKLTGVMLSISTNPYVLLGIVNVLLLVVGMFLDSTTAILVIAPIIAKPLVMAGVDPVHLGMVVVFNLMIGSAHAADGARPVPRRGHRQDHDEGSAEGNDAVLRPVAGDADAHHLRAGHHDLASAMGTGQLTPALDGRVAIVTGGARGIGWAAVEALMEAGAVPVLFDCDAAALDKASRELRARNADHLVQQVDVTDDTEVGAAFAETLERFGRIDILVNNAGTALRRPTIELSAADWRKVIEVNLTGVFLCAREAARVMIPAGRGAIVNVASIMGLSGGGLYPNISYQSSKGGVVNLTRALAVEWAGHGVRVNAVAPTYVRTDLTESLMADPDLLRRILEMTPLRRVAEAGDVASAIVFLASDLASMITGHTLPVDGGFLAQ